MKKAILILFQLACVSVYAQQDPLYSQYLTTPLLINPAYTGHNHNLNGSVAYRKQWAGFDGSPVTMNATGQIALAGNRMGVGLIFLKDEVGSDQTTEAQASYGYHLSLKHDLKLSFGLQAGVVNYRADYSDLTINPDDPKFASTSEWKPTFGAGAMLTSETFMVSFAMPKMLPSSTDADSLATGLYNQNFYLMGAYVWQITYLIKLKPYTLLRYVPNAPLSYDAGAAMTVSDSYTLGLFTRDLNTIGLMAQLDLGEKMRFGYVFEVPMGESVGTKYTTHEVTLGFRLRALKFHDLSAIRNF
ncbi:MAG: type IX secretion system membrane protein PorP/SprF [Cyclobacteriaceae bacterium]